MTAENWPDIKGTLYLSYKNRAEREKAVACAVQILKRGGLVAFPTETVYGLGADALNPVALKKIYRAKGRPPDNPLIIHVASLEGLFPLVVAFPATARSLAETFWPGPLTMILKKNERVPPEATAGLPTVALRVPDHPLALELISALGSPLAAPSANLSGSPSPTTAAHVLEDLAGRIDAVLEGGPSRIGLESTVVDLTTFPPKVLRPGGITLEELSASLRTRVETALYRPEEPVPSPGMKYRHYAPRAPLFLVTGHPRSMQLKIQALAAKLSEKGQKVGILAAEENMSFYSSFLVINLGPKGQPALMASRLYGALRSLDAAGVQAIIAEGVAEKDLGLALMNRLRKAAGENIIQIGEV